MENSSIEKFLSAHPEMAKKVTYHQTVVLFTKYVLDIYKPSLLVNLPPLKFVGGPTKKVITGNIPGGWYLDISVAVITYVGVPVEETSLDIGINVRRAVIHLECYCGEAWIK